MVPLSIALAFLGCLGFAAIVWLKPRQPTPLRDLEKRLAEAVALKAEVARLAGDVSSIKLAMGSGRKRERG